MARKIYYTSKGQPYIKLESGRAKFISKRSAGMADTGDLGDFGKHRKKRMHDTSEVVGISLGELGKLVKAAGKCITIITSKGAGSFCPSHVSMTRRKKGRK
jgi:hypothetical protein